MNAEQALKIVRYTKAAFPSQRLDEYTPDVWCKALAPHDFHEAIAAVDRLVQKQTWASVAEVIAEIKAHRRNGNRLAHDQRVFLEIEQSKATFDPDEARRGYEEATRQLQAKLRERRMRRGETADGAA